MDAATTGMSLAIAMVAGAAIIAPAPAQADAVTYLVNVTVRPGYNSPYADAALGCGYGICDKDAAGRAYRDLVSDVKADFTNVLGNRGLDGDIGSDGSTPNDRAAAARFRGQVAGTVAINPAVAIN